MWLNARMLEEGKRILSGGCGVTDIPTATFSLTPYHTYHVLVTYQKRTSRPKVPKVL